MFDLELDREKNQYETGQRGGSSAEQRQKEADEALQRLSELARRQKELAQQQNQNKQQSLRAALAAGNVAPRSRRVAQADGAVGQKRAARPAVAVAIAVGAIRAVGTIRAARRPAKPQSAAPAKSAESAAVAAGSRPAQSGVERYALGPAVGAATRPARLRRSAGRSAPRRRTPGGSAAHDERHAPAAGVLASGRSVAARRWSQRSAERTSSGA